MTSSSSSFSSSSPSASSTSTRISEISSSGPLADKTLDLTIQILHQICAHEHVFQEFFAVLDRTVKPPIRATKRLYYDRKALFVNPQTGIMAEREDEEVMLRGIIEKITDVQRYSTDNLIPEYWLEKIEQNFLKALSNKQIHLRSVPELDNQVGLFARPTSPRVPPKSRKRKRGAMRGCTTKYKGEISVSGIEFILIAFPTQIRKPRKLGFNRDLMFDDWQGDTQYTCLGLGMARVINHRCSDNVVWRFPRDGMEFDMGIEGVGCMVGQFQKQKKIVWGEQLFAFYSKGFAKKKCQCPNKRYHGKRPTTPPSSSSSGSTRSTSFELRTPDSAGDVEFSPTIERQRARCRKSTRQQSLSNLQVKSHEAEEKNYEDPDADDLDSLRSISPPPVKRARAILSPESEEGGTNAFDQLATMLSDRPNLVTHASLEEELQAKGNSWDNPIEIDDDDDGRLEVNVEDGDEGYGQLDVEEVDDEFGGLESVNEVEWEEVALKKKEKRRRVIVSISPQPDGFEQVGQSVGNDDEDEIQLIKVVKKRNGSVRVDKPRTIASNRTDRSTASMARDIPSFLNLPAADDLTRLKVTQREVMTCGREMKRVQHHWERFERVVDGIKRDDRRYKRSETRWRMYLRNRA